METTQAELITHQQYQDALAIVRAYQKQNQKDVADMQITDLDLSVRFYNCIKTYQQENGLLNATFREMVAKGFTVATFKTMKGSGPRTLTELQEIFADSDLIIPER